MIQPSIDLNLLADQLRIRRVFKKLERQIRRFHGKVVVKTDLDSARRSVDHLLALMRAHPDPRSYDAFQLAAGEALCLHAVVVYCRALVAAGSGRYGADVAFPEPLKSAHKRVASLRNHRLCHYGESADAREASWHDDRAVLAVEDTKLRLRSATSRRGWDVRVVDDLDALTRYSIDIVTRQAKSETELLFDEFTALADDAAFLSIASECKFEPQKFFASLNQANAWERGEIDVFNGVRVGVFTDEG